MHMRHVNDTDGFTFRGWMVSQLHLAGGDLVAFALVYQFANSRAGEYRGNTSYLSAWTGWSERTSRAHLISLTKRGLIVEERGRENNTPYCHYKLGPAYFAKIKTTPLFLRDDPAKMAEITPKKISKAYRKNSSENNNGKENSSEFTPPSPSMVADYVRKFGMADPDGFAIFYIEQMTNNGWICGPKKVPVKNWKNNVLHWVKNHMNEDFSYLKATTPTPKSNLSLSNLDPETYQEMF